MTQDVWVPCVLRPAPRPRVANGRAYMPSWYAAQGKALVAALRARLAPVPEAATAVDLQVLLERPASHWLKSGALRKGAPGWPPARAGDVDNLAKSVLDAAVSAGLLPDDSQVVDLRVSKRYCDLGGTPGFRLQVAVAR